MKTITNLLLLTLSLFMHQSLFAQCPSGVIYLESQSAVDNFTSSYPNCTELLNTLCIGSCSNNTPNTDITNLAGLSEITSVNGNLTLRYVDNLTDLNGLSNLNFVGDNFSAIHAESILNLTGIGDISIAGEFGIFDCDAITSLDGINILSASVIGIQHNPNLTDITSLGSVNMLEGQLVIQNNDLLTNLDGLENITTLSPPGPSFIFIEGNADLSDISAIQNIDAASINSNWPSPDLQIFNNPSLAVCDYPNLCSFLDLAAADPNLEANISNNATGCNSVAEIEAECNPPALPFLTTWKTDNPGSSNSTSITIPTTGTGYSYDVDWENDGVFDDFGVTGNITHDYGTAGTYQVAITGDFPRMHFNNQGDKDKILTIDQWGETEWNSMQSAFSGCSNLVGQANDEPNLSNVTDLSGMFYKAINFNQDISNWDVSSVLYMESMFREATSFNSDIGNWDVSSVTDMGHMFRFATSFNQDISSWDVSSVTYTFGMFRHAHLFNQDISNWDVSNVGNMGEMFNNATSFNQDISDWDISSAWSLHSTFKNAFSFNQDLGDWDVSGVIWMNDVLSYTGLDIENYDNILIGWASQNLQFNVNFGAQELKYCNAEAERDNLINIYSWNVYGDSKDCTCDYILTPTFTHTTCNEDNGTIDITVSNTNDPITFIMNGSPQTFPAIDLAPGDYEIIGEDPNMCKDTVYVTIDNSIGLVMNLQSIGTTCGDNNGTIIPTITSSNGAVTYTLNGQATTLPFESLAPGTYTVHATDEDGCVASDMATIISSQNIDVDFIETATTCGEDNGIIDATVNFSNGTVGYGLDGVPITLPMTDLAPGSYNMAVADQDLCLYEEIVVIAPSQTIDVIFSSTATTCASTNGQINATINFSNGLVTYTLDGNPTSMPAVGLSVGTYVLVATDTDGCSYTESVTVDAIDGLDYSVMAIHTTCNEENGGATVTVITGVEPITYTLDGNVVSFPLSGLAPGAYTIVGTDANGCPLSASLTIDPSSDIDISYTPTHTLCDLDNGSISATETFSNGAVTYTSNGTPATMPITGLAPGDYTIVATDEDGCSITSTVTIDGSDPLDLAFTATNTTCSQDNGGISVSLVTGDSPITFMMNGAPAFFPIVQMAAGSYDITATDANGCIYSEVVIIEPSENLSFTGIPSNTTCSEDNGSVELVYLTGTQPVTYTMAGQPITFPLTDLAPDTYVIIGEDAEGCTYSFTTVIGASDVLDFTLSSTDALCAGATGEIDASVNTGTEPVTYTLDGTPTSMPAIGISAGTYMIEGTDADGCTFSDQIEVIGSDPLLFDMNVFTTTCDLDNGSIDVIFMTGTAPVEYELNGTPQTFPINTLAPGDYTISGTDALGCTYSLSTSIFGSDPLDFDVNVVPATCALANGSTSIDFNTGNAPVTYTLSGFGSNTTGVFTGLASGTYTMDAIDNLGCEFSTSFTIESSNTLDAALSVDHTTCAEDNGTVTLNIISGNPPYDIILNGAPQTGTSFSDLSPGTYTVDLMDDDGCTWSETVMVNSSTLPTMDIDFKSTSCGDDNGEIYITPSMGVAPYEINIGTGFTYELGYENLPAGTYMITIRDAEGCETDQSITIEDSRPIAYTTYVDDADCGNLSGVITLIALDGTEPFLYSIANDHIYRQNGSGSFSYLESGQYFATIMGDDGCKVSEMITVYDNPGVVLDINLDHPSCGETNGILTIKLGETGTKPYKVYMDGNLVEDSLYSSYEIPNLSNGDYNIKVTDYYGCTDSGVYTINDGNSIVKEFEITHVQCNGTLGEFSTIIGEPGNYTFSMNGETNANGSFSDLEPGFYQYIATDSMGCDYITEVEIKDHSFSDVRVLIIDQDCSNKSNIKIIPENGTGPYQYFVNGRQYFENGANDLELGTYIVEVLDANGCSVNQEIQIEGESTLAYTVEICQSPKSNQLGFIKVQASGGEAPYFYKLDQYLSKRGRFINLKNTEYTLTITDSFGCSASFPINLCDTNIDIVEKPSKRDGSLLYNVTVYPNPGHNTLHINHGISSVAETIIVFNATGQIISETSSTPDQEVTTLQTEEWNKGIYFIKYGQSKMIKWFKL